jgi:hypothetical protein
MAYLTLVLLTGLCFVFPPAWIYAVLGAGALLYLYPLLTLGVLLAGGVALYYIHQH